MFLADLHPLIASIHFSNHRINFLLALQNLIMKIVITEEYSFLAFHIMMDAVVLLSLHFERSPVVIGKREVLSGSGKK